jgi:hypothetical protein
MRAGAIAPMVSDVVILFSLDSDMKRWVYTLPLQVVCDAQVKAQVYAMPCKLSLQVFTINKWCPLVVYEQCRSHWNRYTSNLERWNAVHTSTSR